MLPTGRSSLLAPRTEQPSSVTLVASPDCLFMPCLSVYAESVREEDLDAVEAQIGCKLPEDYRCSFRIHNGQKLVVPG